VPVKRSLQHVGGRSELAGDPELARALAHCMAVRPARTLPFTHGFHAYPARMHPEIASRVIERFAPSGTRVLDPFVGSGTTAVEALRAGLAFRGIDIARVALEIAWVRTRVLVPDQCRLVEAEGARIAQLARRFEIDESAALPAWARAIRRWFAAGTLQEIAALKMLIDQVRAPDLRRQLTGVLSSLLVKLSHQASDSVTVPDRAQRSWSRGASFGLFRSKCRELTTRLLTLASDLHRRRVTTIEPRFERGDARIVALENESFDLAFTSPPYPATYDYASHHQLRSALYGDDARFVGEHEIGSRRELATRRDAAARYRADTDAWSKNVLRALAPGGRMIVLIGDGTAADRAIASDEVVSGAVARLGARTVASASQLRPDWARGGRAKREHLMLIQK
jgi:16S rRNA G966 N2-methylase RsmD